MKRTKTQKGITLIALIITIVVLLILTVVAIREINGDGIIAKARKAQEEYTDAQAQEAIELGKQAYMLENNGKFDLSDFKANIDKYVEGASINGDNVIINGTSVIMANWSTEPTAGTWYVSDECVLFDENGYAYGLRRNLDWCNNILQMYENPEEDMPTYGLYMGKMMEVETTKLVFSDKVKKIKQGNYFSGYPDDFAALLFTYFMMDGRKVDFLYDNVEFEPNISIYGGMSGSYTIPNSLKSLPDHFITDANNIDELTIPSTVQSISKNAFNGIGNATRYSEDGCTTRGAIINVVRGTAGDIWAQAKVAENPDITINYITSDN